MLPWNRRIMKQLKKKISIIIGLIIVCAILTNFTVDKKDINTVRQTKKPLVDSIPRLFSTHNLGNFYYTDNGYDIHMLTEHKNNPLQRIVSISVYRFSSATQTMLLQDSILLNREGKPVVKMTPYSSGLSSTYFFYDNRGNGFLDVTILENKYDTLYTLRRFDRFNREYMSVQYNITRKELDYLTTTDISPVSDSVVKLKLIKFEPDIKYKNVLPFESRYMLIKQVKDSLVNVSTDRIVYDDTTYNSTYKNLFNIENNFLVPENEIFQFTFNSQGDWIEKKNKQFDIQRKFLYYGLNDDEIKTNLSANASVLNYLYSQMDSLPSLAWANFKKKQNSFEIRSKLFENGTYGDSIGLKEGNTIEDFLPELWYQVSAGYGNIPGFDSICYGVGYNTPIKNDDGYNKRCLAIYERQNGKYRLIKQSFGAIEDFNDADNDLLFDGYDETKFSVDIEGGDIIINYEYMRGEASYEYAYNKGNWILVRYGSGHRTCCQSESYSYDYVTKTYSYSVFSLGDDDDNESGDLPRDTSITVIQDRPIMYMDSLNVRNYDYDETGLLIK